MPFLKVDLLPFQHSMNYDKFLKMELQEKICNNEKLQEFKKLQILTNALKDFAAYATLSFTENCSEPFNVLFSRSRCLVLEKKTNKAIFVTDVSKLQPIDGKYTKDYLRNFYNHMNSYYLQFKKLADEEVEENVDEILYYIYYPNVEEENFDKKLINFNKKRKIMNKFIKFNLIRVHELMYDLIPEI